MIAAVTVMFVPSPAAQAAGTMVVDPNTTNAWTQYTRPDGNPSTQNVGRIWTDKSVFTEDYTFDGEASSLGGQQIGKGDSDFLVGLSALSSTSNLKTTTTTSQPLDIVLVLDDSGSMAYDIDYEGNRYKDVYTPIPADQVVESHGHSYDNGWWTEYSQDTRGGTYYIQNERGDYSRVNEETERYGNRYNGYDEHIRWTVNGQEVDPETTQFYTYERYDLGERRGALQYAVNNFIDQTAAMNAQIADQDDKIRLSIVVFEDNASIENHLTVCEGENVSVLKETVNDLRANGATNAGAGMTNANTELHDNSNRPNTKQVVIFFTDGVPTTSSSFSEDVADTAVDQSNQIKNRGGSVYSIGIFDGANPNETEVRYESVGWGQQRPVESSQANVFMNAVSSNYPNPTAWDELGRRATGDPDFYKSADNASSLNEVFQDIFDESTENAGSGSPIVDESQEGNTDPGDLTFSDVLGSYMEVTGIDGGGLGNPNVMKVAYADKIITSDRRTEERDDENGVTTYTYDFSGTVGGNAVYGEADLANLKVTVKHYDDPAKGDEVTATIPADLLPMRNYDVDTNAGTMTVTPAYPIRLFYGVSLKQDAEDAIEAGSGDVYDAILATNKSADGTNAEFLTNQWTKNNAQGDTTASFIPNAGNKFYYYTSNTPLYIDKQCMTRATRTNIDGLDTLYYSEPYWVQTEDGTTARQVTTGIALDLNGADWDNAEYQDGQGYYIPADTQRFDRPSTLNSGKNEAEGGNRTATASSVLTPAWEGTGVSQHLGNNGKMTFPLPGQLEIKKNVDWGNASNETKANQNSFEFTVDFNGADTLAGEYDYDVFGQGEDPVRHSRVSDGDAIKLAANQRAVIYGLSNGTTFTVTETGANQNGFTTTDQSADPNNVTNDGVTAGTIVGGSQQSVAFQNNYRADKPLTVDMASYLKVKKDLRDRDWRDTDEFTFDVQSVDMGSGVVAPTNSSVTITEATKDQAVSFGDIVFTTTGTFRYIVSEVNDTDPIAGIDYSSASYRLEITIGDAGNGNLKVDSYKLERLQNDAGSMEPGTTEPVQGDTVTFVNTYLPDADATNIDGIKNYTDNSGGNSIINNKFQFQMEALGGYVTGTGSRDELTISAGDTPKPTENTQGNVTTIGNEGGEFHMPAISYDGNTVGNTYVYRITEVEGSEEGMAYDKTSYEVEVTVTEEPEPGAGEGHAHITASVNKTPQDLTFTNTYDPTDVTLGADGVAPIKGTKALNGRAMQPGEQFHFQLTALNDNAKTVLSDAKTVTVDDPNSMDFDFGEMTFTKVGQYTFQVNEVADDQGSETTDGNGMTFDTNIATVTVDVTLNKDEGKLEATVSYVNDKHDDVTDHAQFTNVYEANMNYGAGGINVTKTMIDRSMAVNDYTFTITGEGAAADLLAKDDKSFGNAAAQANGTVTMSKLQDLTFDQTDAGKTYTFLVDEVLPAEGDRIAGVEYDQSEYRVAIAVYDNHDGTMHTVTTVTRTKDAAGSEVDERVAEWNSDVDKGDVPTIDFTNTYKPTPAELTSDADTGLRVRKVVTGAPSPEGVEYGFTLTAKDTAEGPIANIGGLTDGKLTTHTTGVINADGEDGTDDDAQTVPFAGTLTFSKPGTYTFTVQEDVPAADEGWSFGTDPKTVTVAVSDRNTQGQYDGALHIVSVTNDGLVTIENSYEPGAVVVGGDGADQQITVQKSVTGADSTADFTFAIEPVIDDDHTNEWWRDRVSVADGFTPETTISGVTEEQAGMATFDAVTFNATGEYQFKITEAGAADFNKGDDRAGWTYDEHEAIVTVSVTDDDFDGQLEAEVSYDNSKATTDADEAVDNAAAFTNKYEAGSTTLNGSTDFKGTKTIEGRNGIEGETFGFTLEQGSVDDGASWDAVTFQPKDGDASAFNTATATATMQKGKNSADFSFDGTFTFAKAGTYAFNVTETSHNGEALPEDGTNGMTYDRHTGTITVTVTDDGKGNLHATAAPGTITEGDAENDMTFENAYQATPGRWGLADSELLGGHKYINDTTGNTYTLEADQFSFTMRAQAAGNPMPEGWDGTTVDDQGRGMMTVTNGTGNATDVSIYDFGWIEFTHADMAGATEVENKPGVFAKTFQYNIFETGTMPAGISRDNTAYTVTFTVTEDHNTGKITVATPTATKIVEGSGGAGDPADVTKLDFTNTYNPTSIEGHQNFFKTLVGRNWQQGDSFTFDVSMTATEADGSEWPAGAPLPSVKASDGYDFSEVKTNAAGNGLDYTVTINPSSQTGNTYRFDTGTITYEREGIYTWTVSEQQSTVDHVTADSTVYTITVTVTDEGGVLKRSVQVTGGNYTDHEGDQTLDFTNVYKPSSVSTDDPNGIGNIQVTKEVKGNATSAAFNFNLTLVSGDAANVLTNKDDPQSAFPADGITKATSGDFADGDTKAVDFGALTFTAEGDYTFKVVETDTAPANWTYESGDANAKTITIHVTDPDNGGQLVASYDKEAANNPTFTNSYKAEGTLDGDAEGTKNLMVAKTIDGRKFQKDDTFSFQLTADKNNPAVATLPENADGITIAYADGDDTASKTAAFGDITFTLPGTYTFYVSEKAPADADKLGGMTYSDEQYTVTVEVTDAQDGNGKLDAAITKIVNKAGDEVDGLAFTNTYEPGGTTDLPETGKGSIQLRKVLTGKEWDGDEFKFQLTAKSATTPDGSEIGDVPMPEQTEKTVSAKTGTEDGNDYADFGFGPITYSQAGTYVYEVSETVGDNAGISYDDHKATVTVTVVDNLHGGFTATASVENGTFTNMYHSELDYNAAGGVEIVKTFNNADMREFSFTVTPADQASADKLGIDMAGETFITKPGATVGDDNASHAEIMVIDAATEAKFTQDDADDTYTYTVQETKGTDGSVTYDGTVYTVTIATADDGQGGIKVTTTVTDGADYTQTYVYDNDDATDDPTAVIPFTNTYTATGELGGNGSTSIKATKTLTNRPMTDGEFTFNVTNAADPAGTVVATGTNAADGTVTFGAIGYSIDQMLKDVDNGLATPIVVDGKNTFTYQYTVAEDQTGFDEGVTAIADSFSITVTVTDNGDGTLGIAVTYPDGGDGLTFRNAYGEGEQGQATLNIAGEKIYNIVSGDKAPAIEGKYTFTLTGEDGAPMPDTTTATNDDAGNVTFGDVTYTMENVFGDTGDDGTATLSAQRTRTFTYTVTESGAVDGVANDPEASKTFTVTVTDNGDGTLRAVSDPAQGAKFSFTNTYSVKPTDSSATGKGGITVTKKLTGRDLQDGEFSFELVDHNGQKVAEGTNDADGNVELGAVTFTEPGVYPYTIREVNTALASVDYDAAEHAVTATVTDNGDGTLSVTWKLDGDAPATFTNTYDPVDASVVIGTSKVLDGRELKDGEFTFQLTGADESTPMPEDAKDGVATATNAANGSIGFGTIVYDQAGTYKYTVSEVNDKQDGVTYDDTTYEVTVTVTDNTAEGRLEATVDYGDATALVFTNTYKKAEATIPKTGAAVILPSVIGFILLLGAGGMYASRRRKRS